MKLFKKKPKKFKRCPRCGNKCTVEQTKCEECDLVFSRLADATNKAARKKLRHFDSDYVIYTSQLPRDVKWWKLVLMCAFFGVFGGHYYYVGKYIKGGLMSVAFVLTLFCVIFNAYMVNLIESALLYIPIAIMGVAWLFSLSLILSKKFKVPIAIDDAQNVLDAQKRFEKSENAK